MRYAIGQATGKFPGPGELRLVGGSPRYQLYPTTRRQARRLRRAGAEVLGSRSATRSALPAPLMNDLADPEATKAAVADIIARETAEHWRPKFAAADCCVTIMASLEEALHDPHFVERGLFAHQVAGRIGRDHAGAAGADCRDVARKAGRKASPKLGADNDLLR